MFLLTPKFMSWDTLYNAKVFTQCRQRAILTCMLETNLNELEKNSVWMIKTKIRILRKILNVEQFPIIFEKDLNSRLTQY